MGLTQEEKQLLLKDLCARLPYGVMVHATIDGDNTLLGVYNDRVFTTCEEHGKHNDYPLDCVKPYLRSMSSITEEEREELYQKTGFRVDDCILGLSAIDWLLANHFDYRGLIPMGLALEALEGMYK